MVCQRVCLVKLKKLIMCSAGATSASHHPENQMYIYTCLRAAALVELGFVAMVRVCVCGGSAAVGGAEVWAPDVCVVWLAACYVWNDA